MIRVHENIVKILRSIKNKGVPCALCTGKERKRTIEILKHFNLEYYFDIVVCSDDVQVPKPDTESILTIMNKFGIGKENCIMIGDGIMQEYIQ
jgi:AHBA synthesis associated protein